MNALVASPAYGLDAQTLQLVQSLKHALDARDNLRLDAIAQAGRQLCERLLQHRAAPASAPAERYALAPWQERKAKEILSRSLSSRLFIADVAQQCALSRSHFSRAFKKATGLSPQEWSLNHRISKAKELLGSSALAISQISQECGFADQSHFCRAFHKAEGTTPNKWRRLQEGEKHPARQAACATGRLPVHC